MIDDDDVLRPISDMAVNPTPALDARSPDKRLNGIVRALARHAARQAFREECKRANLAAGDQGKEFSDQSNQHRDDAAQHLPLDSENGLGHDK